MPFARPPRHSSAFTLLELLTVMAITAILATIVLSLVSSSNQRAAIARTRSELALIVQGLEEYKKFYGDYPETGPSIANSHRVTLGTSGVSAGPGATTAQARLLNALIGVYGPNNFVTRLNGPSFIDVGKLTLEIPFSSPTLTTPNQMATFGVATGLPPTKTAVNNCLVDPWGNRYMYFYKTATTAAQAGRPSPWIPSTYILYSVGPDGASTTLPNTNTGIYTGTTQTSNDNADNIYADKLP